VERAPVDARRGVVVAGLGPVSVERAIPPSVERVLSQLPDAAGAEAYISVVLIGRKSEV